jgi:hypothetical protein
MTLSRRQVLLSAGGAWLAHGTRAAAAADRYDVEDWRSQPLGQHGIPAGWRAYETPGGHPKYDFTVVEDAGHRALRMHGESEHSTIAKEITVDLTATPMVTWSWKMVALPIGADLRHRATSDAAGHLFVIWPRFPEMIRSRLIGYVWDPHAAVDSVIPSQKTGTVTFIVVRSGTQGLGTWIEERRDVIADFRRVHDAAPPNPRAVALSIDTNDTRSRAETLIGPIAFRRR